MLTKREQNSDIIAEIDHRIDKFYDDYMIFDPKIRDLLVEKGSSTRQAKALLRHYVPVLKEIHQAVKGEDGDLLEAYSHLPRQKLDNYLVFMHNICNELAKFSLDKHKKVGKRSKPRMAVSKHFVYKKTDAALNLTSMEPDSIIGAKSVLLYNTKYKRITFLVSKDDGLSIYRMGILSYNEALSMTKQLPETQLSEFLNGTEEHVKQLMTNLKSKKFSLGNRAGPDTLILRVFE